MKLKLILCLCLLTSYATIFSQLCEATLVGYRYDAYSFKKAYPQPGLPYYTNGSLMGYITENKTSAKGHLLNYDKWGVSFIGVALMMAPGSGWSPFYFADDNKNDRHNRGKERGFYVGDWVAFGFGMGVYKFSESRLDNGTSLYEYEGDYEVNFRGNLDLGLMAGYRLEADKSIGLRYYLTAGGWGMGKNFLTGLKLDLFARFGRLAGRFGLGNNRFNESPGFDKRKEIEVSLYFLEVIRQRWSLNLKYNCLTKINGEKSAINSFSAGIGFVLF